MRRSNATCRLLWIRMVLAGLLLLGARHAFPQHLVHTITRPDWEPAALALDLGGNRLFVGDANTGQIYLFDATTFEEQGIFPTGLDRMADMVLDEAHGRLYAACPGIYCHQFAVLDAATGSSLGLIQLPNHPANFPRLAIDKGLGKVYVGYSGGLIQVDGASGETVNVPVRGITANGDMCVNPVTHEVYLVNFAWPMDVVDGRTLAHFEVAGVKAIGVTANWLENKAVTTYNMYVFERDTGTIKELYTQNDATEAIFSPQSNRIFTSAEVFSWMSVVDGATDEIRDLPMLGGRVGMGVREATGHLYLANSDPIVVLDGATLQVELLALESAGNPGAPPREYLYWDVEIDQERGLVYTIEHESVRILQDAEMFTRPPVYAGDTQDLSVHTLDPSTRRWVDESFDSIFPTALEPWPGRGEMFAGDGSGDVQLFEGCGHNSATKVMEPFFGGVCDLAAAPWSDRLYMTGRMGTESLAVATDPKTYCPVVSWNLGEDALGCALTPDERKLYVAMGNPFYPYPTGDQVAVIDTATDQVTSYITVGLNPWGVAVHPAGGRAFVALSGDNAVGVLDTGTDALVGSVPVGEEPHWLALSPDGRLLFVTNRGDSSVSVIDTGTAEVSQTVPLGERPEGLAVSPFGHEVYVATESGLSIVSLPDYSVEAIPAPLATNDHPAILGPVAVLDPTARIAGRVTAGGVPVAGSEVRALQGGVEKGSADADPSGRYVIAGLIPGSYDVRVSAPGHPEWVFPALGAPAGRIRALSADLDAAVSLPGDCDSDGSLAIGEVQRAIAMYLGTQAPACQVDSNGDGQISIGDVQRVILVYLGLSACALECAAAAGLPSGEAPATVQFAGEASSATCSGTLAYEWDFGDGGSSIQKDPKHIYAKPGSYTWSFRAAGGGSSCSRTGTVTVSTPPDMPLESGVPLADSLEGCVKQGMWKFYYIDVPGGDTRLVADLYDLSGHAYLYLKEGERPKDYDYDCISACGRDTPGHCEWLVAGAGRVWLGVANSSVGLIQYAIKATLTSGCDLTCTAAATPSSGQAPLRVYFSATTAPETCTGGLTFRWDFGDGATSPGSLKNFQHFYAAEGTFTWTFTATGGGTSCIRTGTVTVSLPPATQLASGVPVDGSLSVPGQWKYYYIDVPAGIAHLTVELYNLTNNGDLFLRSGLLPTLADFDCRPWKPGTTSETCEEDISQPGRWWIGVTCLSAASLRYSVKATMIP